MFRKNNSKKKVVKLNESHLTNIIKKVIRENTEERELNLRNKSKSHYASIKLTGSDLALVELVEAA